MIGSSSDVVEAVLIALLTGVAAGIGALLAAGRQLGRVSMSDDGLELAAPRHRAAFLPWAEVASARLRFAGPFTQLVVTPAGPEAVFVADGRGRIPRLRRGALLIEVGVLAPGPAALLAELDRRRTATTR